MSEPDPKPPQMVVVQRDWLTAIQQEVLSAAPSSDCVIVKRELLEQWLLVFEGIGFEYRAAELRALLHREGEI